MTIRARAAFRGGGEGHSPPLAGCLPPLEIYSVALAYRACLPLVCRNSHFAPHLKIILNSALLEHLAKTLPNEFQF